MRYPLIDSHCHLADEVFEADLESVVERAREAGVSGALCILEAGSDEEAARVPRLRELWPALRFSAGVHPHRASQYGADLSRVQSVVRAALEANDATLALGEIGLDYHYDFAPREVQQEVFRLQVELARELDLPIVIHTREADADTLRILREAGGGVRGVFHCFTGDEALARAALDLGFHISFSGIATFPRAESLRHVARLVPADRRLIETDSPYLAPPPFRGKRNEPAWVARVAAIVAEALGETASGFAAQTAKNFMGLFERAALDQGT
jgi:TatD DNase family protein